MSYTSGNSSKASNKEVKENMNDYKRGMTNDIHMGFKVSGGYVSVDQNLDKLNMKETETINHAIPMFDVVEKSFGTYNKVNDVIYTNNYEYSRGKNGKLVSKARRELDK